MKLNHDEIAALEPRERPYKKFVGGGLLIHVMPNGSKHWRYKYRYDGKENKFTIGSFPLVSPDRAYREMMKAKSLLLEGIDPNQAKREERLNRPKPASRKDLFRMSVDSEGGLQIETENKILMLSPSQTIALKAFINASPLEDSYAD